MTYGSAPLSPAFASSDRTLSVALGLGLIDRPAPKWWPTRSTALLERIRPDDVRFGASFPRFRVVRSDIVFCGGPWSDRSSRAKVVAHEKHRPSRTHSPR